MTQGQASPGKAGSMSQTLLALLLLLGWEPEGSQAETDAGNQWDPNG